MKNRRVQRKWTLLSLIFDLEEYGIKISYDQINTTQADMGFIDIKITQSVH